MDAKETEFYERVLAFLEPKWGYDSSKEKLILNSGDNSVLMKGEFAGYSLASLKSYVAKKQGKLIEYEHDEY